MDNVNDVWGSLFVKVYAARGALPIEQAKVVIVDADGQVFATMYTDSSGETPVTRLPAPAIANSMRPGLPDAYATYYVSVSHPSYQTLSDLPVSVFGGIIAVLPVNMLPKNWPEVM